MRTCKPRGFYTVGKGLDRVVHPVCGRGLGDSHVRARARKAERFAKAHGLKTGPPIMVPRPAPRTLESFRPVTPTLRALKPSRRISASVRRREIRESKKLKGEAGLNMRVTGTLARRFPGRLPLILEQANAAYHYRNPGLEINPEPYELSEGGFIDEALDSLGLPHVATVGS